MTVPCSQLAGAADADGEPEAEGGDGGHYDVSGSEDDQVGVSCSVEA